MAKAALIMTSLITAGRADAAQTSLYDRVAAVLAERYYDPSFRERTLPALISRYRPRRGAEANLTTQRRAVQALLTQIPATHLALLSTYTFDRLMAELRGDPRATPGFDLVEQGDAFLATNLLEGGAAERAGLRPWDRVLAIDGIAPAISARLDWRSDDTSLDDTRDPALHFIKAAAGDRMEIRYQRGAEAPRSVMVQAELDSALAAARRSVTVREIHGRRIGYIHLWYVHLAGVAELFDSALAGPLADIDALVLDLRGRGGSPQGAAAVVAALTRAHEARGLRIAVLVDRQTRSAKDLLSAQLSAYDWVTLVGEPTAGAVIPASFAEVGDGAVLMFPSFALGEITERMERRGGVQPDVLVARGSAGDQDAILARGLEIAASLPAAVQAAPHPSASSVDSRSADRVALPTWSVLRRSMIEALGGEAMIRSWRPRRMEGQSELVGLPMAGPYRAWAAPPDRQRVDATFGSMATSQAVNGAGAWSRSPQTGLVRLTRAALERAHAQAMFHGVLDWNSAYASIVPVRAMTFDGRNAIELEARTASGGLTRLYVDQSSALLIGVAFQTDSPLGEIEVSTAMRGHRAFEGVILPTEIVITAAGQSQRFTVENVVFGPIAEEIFAEP